MPTDVGAAAPDESSSHEILILEKEGRALSRLRRILGGTLLFNALSAFGGGIALATGTLPVPMYLLRNTPFDSYVIPGLFLGIVIGGSALAGAIALLAHLGRSLLVCAAAGVIMVGWIIGETLLIQGFSWLQGLYLLSGILVVGLSRQLAIGPVAAPGVGALRQRPRTEGQP